MTRRPWLQAFESQLKETGSLCNRLENRTFASTLSCENRIFVLGFGFGNSTTFSGTLINNEFVTGMYTFVLGMYTRIHHSMSILVHTDTHVCTSIDTVHVLRSRIYHVHVRSAPQPI